MSSVHSTDRALGRAGRGALAGSGAFKSLGRSLAFASAYFLSFAAAARLIRSSIGAAIDLQRQTQRTTMLFGNSAPVIKGWAKTTANSLGLARGESLKAAADFGTMFRGFGVGAKTAAQFSKSLVKRAADLASFRNVDFSAVAGALQKGLGGMGRGLKVFGIDLTATRLKAEALRLGLIKGAVDMHQVVRAQDAIAISAARLAQAQQKYGRNSIQAVSAGDRLSAAQDKLAGLLKGKVPGSLTAAQKALAAYAIEMHDTSLEQGFFAKHSGQLGEEQKRLKALLGNVREELGTALLPTILKYTSSLVDWLSKSKNQETVLRDVKSAVHVLTQGISAAVAVLRPMVRGAEAVANAVGGWKRAFEIVISGYLAFKFVKLALAVKEFAAAIKLSRVAMIAFGGTGSGSFAASAAMMAGSLNAPIGKVGKLRAALVALSRLGPFVIAVGISEFLAKKLGLPGPMHDQVTSPGSKPPSWETKGMKPLAGGWYQSGSHFLHWNPKSGKFDKDTSTKPVSALGPGRMTSGGTPGHFGGPVPAQRPTARTIADSGAATDAAARAAAAAARRRRRRLEQLRQAQPFNLPMNLQLEEAKAGASGVQRAVVKAARDVRAYLLKAIPHLKGQRLLTAYGLLQSANDTIASAIKAAADKAKQAAAAAKQKFQQAVDNVRQQIGELFQGPILAPTQQQSKASLGLPGPKAKDLTKDLRAQTALFARFNKDLAILAKRGASKQLLKELRAKGPADIAEVEALAKASRKDLRAFFKAFGKRELEIRKVALVELRAAHVNIKAAHLTIQGIGHRAAPQHGHRIKKMGDGGIAVGPTLALIGERGPEAVVPLSRGGRGGIERIEVPVILDGHEVTRVVSNRQKRNTGLGVSQVRGRHGGRNAMGPV